jgi:glycosyltransferase involved in cell wall biosynthesis
LRYAVNPVVVNHQIDDSIRRFMDTDSKRETFLFVIPWSLAELGGVNQVVINLAREMVKSGTFEPVVLTTDWDAVDPIWEEVHGLKTLRWRIRSYRRDSSMKERLAYMLWEWRFRPAFQRFCREHRVAAINLHYPGSSSFTLDRIIRGLASAVPLILSFHGSDVSSIRSASASAKAQWRRLLLRAEGIVVCSSDLGKRLVAVLGNEVASRVIFNGIDATAFAAMEGTPRPTGERFILNVGQYCEKKGQDVLIEAFAAIVDDYPDVNLVLVGQTDPALSALKELCARKGIDERVRFFPDEPHHQVAEFFRRATVFALPSRQEPFGIVLLEAGAFGLPVVASRVGGIPEILTDGFTGRLVAPDNPVELAICLRSLLDSPVTAQEMGERLRHHVLTSFTWTVAYERYMALLKDARVSADESRK